MTQTDLFEAKSSTPRARFPETAAKLSFLDRHRVTVRFDQLLIVVIVFIISHTLAFSFGVEQGKNIVRRGQVTSAVSNPVTTVAQQVSPAYGIPSVLVAGEKPGPIVIETSVKTESGDKADALAEKKDKSLPPGKFTIQLVTYTSQSQAEERIKLLLERGHKGFVIPSGKYLLVCVDGFDSRQAANHVLKNLRNMGDAPPDAYVRMVPRS